MARWISGIAGRILCSQSKDGVLAGFMWTRPHVTQGRIHRKGLNVKRFLAAAMLLTMGLGIAGCEPAPAPKPAGSPPPAMQGKAGAPPADTKPAETKPADEKPADEKPADEKPADEKPAEEKPAEEKPAEEKKDE